MTLDRAEVLVPNGFACYLQLTDCENISCTRLIKNGQFGQAKMTKV